MGGCPANGSLAQETANGLAFYQHPSGSDGPPSPGAVASDFTRGFDTYLAAGPEPVSGGGPAPLALSETVTFAPQSFAGQWGASAQGFAHSRPTPLPLPAFGVQAVFIGRFTTPRGEGLTLPPTSERTKT